MKKAKIALGPKQSQTPQGKVRSIEVERPTTHGIRSVEASHARVPMLNKSLDLSILQHFLQPFTENNVRLNSVTVKSSSYILYEARELF
jgi:hypothetical protein